MKAGWESTTVGSLSDVVTKGTTPTSVGHKFTETGINFIKVESLSEHGQFIASKLAHISEDCHETLRRSQIKEGDILFSIAGALGRTAIVPADIVPANTNQALSIIRLKDNAPIHRPFLLYALSSGMLIEQIEKARGGVAQQNLSLAQVKAFNIPLPPLEEQQRIVAVLDEAFEGLARARAHAEANLQNARELFDEAEAKLFRDISNGSTETTLGEIASFRNGLNYSRTSRGDEVKVVGVGDFQDNFTVPTETLSFTKIDGQLSEDDKLLEGDILAVRSNGNRELIGRTMLMPESDEPTSFSGFTIRIRLNDEGVMPEYVCSFLRTKTARQKLTAGGGGANISNLNQRILSSFPISYPDKDGQRDALDRLERLRENSKGLRESYTAKLQDLDDLRQSLLHKAFAGEFT